MPQRAETIRKRFLRHLHRAVFHTVPNDAPSEVDLSRLKPRQQDSFGFSFEWYVQDAPAPPSTRKKF
jgi:hypothetical protein